MDGGEAPLLENDRGLTEPQGAGPWRYLSDVGINFLFIGLVIELVIVAGLAATTAEEFGVDFGRETISVIIGLVVVAPQAVWLNAKVNSWHKND